MLGFGAINAGIAVEIRLTAVEVSFTRQETAECRFSELELEIRCQLGGYRQPEQSA